MLSYLKRALVTSNNIVTIVGLVKHKQQNYLA